MILLCQKEESSRLQACPRTLQRPPPLREGNFPPLREETFQSLLLWRGTPFLCKRKRPEFEITEHRQVLGGC